MAPVMPDEKMVFYLTVANNGRLPGNFILGLDHTTNKKGLVPKLGGSDMGGLHGEVTTTLTVEKGPRGYLFEPLVFAFHGDWDGDNLLEAKMVQVWNFEDKDKNRWIRFEEPCPKVEWAGKIGREKKAVVDKNSKPLDLTIHNTRKVCVVWEGGILPSTMQNMSSVAYSVLAFHSVRRMEHWLL